MSPKIVVLTGIDGTGKSSNARMLVDELTTDGVQAQLAQQFRPILLGPFFRHICWSKTSPNPSNSDVSNQKEKMNDIIGESKDSVDIVEKTGSFSKDAPHGYRSDSQKDPSTWETGILIPLLYLNLVFLCLRAWTKLIVRWQADVVVFDRYYFDEIVKLERRYSVGINKNTLGLASILFPQPCMVISLTADPDVCFRREEDGDRTREEMWEMAQLQSCVLHRYKGVVYDINTEQDQTTVADKIRQAVYDGLPTEVI